MTDLPRSGERIDSEIDRAVQAARSAPPVDTLPPNVRAAVLARMHTTAHRHRGQMLLQWIAANRLRPLIAAAASLLITLAAITAVAALLGGPGVAFADVKTSIQHAQSMEMTVASTVGEAAGLVAMHMKMHVKASGLVRMETASGESVIADAAQKMILVIEPAQRRAMLIDIPELPDRSDASPRNILERMRQLLDGSEKPLGRQQFDGRWAQGFSVTRDDRDMEVWADESTGELVLIRLSFHIEGMPPTHITLRNIVLNPDMPDSWFHLVPPEGFTLENRATNLGTPGEQDLSSALGDLARWNRGVFPDQLQPSPEMAETIQRKLSTLPDGDRTARVQTLTRMVFFAALRYEQDFHYAGGDVKLGDADTPIAWWKPAGAHDYRVLMGDLTFRDLPNYKLPATEPPAD